LNQEAERYLAVTLDDIKRVAKLYFAPTNRTVLDVIPAKAASAAKAPATKAASAQKSPPAKAAAHAGRKP
jgi:hypothetical protein